MKAPSRAPVYATLYPGLCAIARELGYALSIHGSLADDLDLIAVPWVEDAKDPETLVEAIRELCDLCFDHRVPITHWEPEVKPHGRIAWKLYFENGCSVDLSVMPKK